MASETVVSHNVMVSGLFPKHMGWSDEAIRDVDNVWATLRRIRTPSSPSATWARRLRKLIDHDGLPEARRLPARGVPRHRSSPTSARRAIRSTSMAASSSDYWVRMGSKKRPPTSPTRASCRGRARTAASGGNPPAVHRERPRASRQRRQRPLRIERPRRPTTTTAPRPTSRPGCTPRTVATCRVRTPATRAATTGSPTPAIKIIENEDWSALWHLTFSAIDKIGHMWGGGAVDTVAN